mgnify:CR=1 FL=1
MNASLQLAKPATVKLYKPTPLDGTSPEAALQPVESHAGATAIDLKVPDHVLVVEIAPASH